MWTTRPTMERLCVVILYIFISFTSNALAISDAGIYSRRLKVEIHKHGNSRTAIQESLKKMKLQIQEGLISKPQLKYLTVEPDAVTLNSPFFLPPFDSLAPTPLPEISPPFCEDAPPLTPHSPPLPPPPPQQRSGLPPPSGMIYSSHIPPPPPPPPPPPAFKPSVPTRSLSPPPPPTPLSPLAPYENISSPTPPPSGPPPSPPHHNGPSSPKHGFGPPSHGLSPPVFLPPVVFPPPAGPPPAQHGGKPPRSSGAAWCVAKPTVPDPIIQVAMDYACGSGADCKSIQPSGHCYEPDTILAHASFAFNSYWQYTKVTGGTCDFGGTAMIVTVDPSFEGCKFVLIN